MPAQLLLPNLNQVDAELIWGNGVGIFTDADGTLSEIVDHSENARVSTEMVSALQGLNEVYPPIVVVSGRRARDVSSLVGLEKLVYIGVHGLERLQEGRLFEESGASDSFESIARARTEIEQKLARATGLRLEDKKTVLAVHYRQCQDQVAIESARELVHRVAADHGLIAQEGRRVVEIRPPLADKGLAVMEFARKNKLRQIIYLGDDRTDIDAFKALGDAAGRSEVLALRVAVVGDESPPGLKENADYWVESVDQVREFFEWLTERGRAPGRFRSSS